MDDQWAIALPLGFPERLKIEGFVAADYGKRGGQQGMTKSRASLETTLEAAGMAEKFTLKNGSDPITYQDRVPQSPLWNCAEELIQCRLKISAMLEVRFVECGELENERPDFLAMRLQRIQELPLEQFGIEEM